MSAEEGFKAHTSLLNGYIQEYVGSFHTGSSPSVVDVINPSSFEPNQTTVYTGECQAMTSHALCAIRLALYWLDVRLMSLKSGTSSAQGLVGGVFQAERKMLVDSKRNIPIIDTEACGRTSMPTVP